MNDVLQVNGGSPLHGEITVRGAKNFVSKAMVAALLGEGFAAGRVSAGQGLEPPSGPTSQGGHVAVPPELP